MSGGRIRTIKPEILDDEKTARLSHLGWRTFVSMMLLADDYGNMRAAPQYLQAQIMWGRPDGDISDAIGELEDAGLVLRYEVNGQEYLNISGWHKHQKVDRPGRPRVPGPGGDEPEPLREKVGYFIRGRTTGLIKIGSSHDPVARCRDLSRQGSEVLELLAVGGKERDFHKKHAKFRVHGEWFRASDEILKEIRDLGFNPDVPLWSTGSVATDRDRSRHVATYPDHRPPTTDHDPDLRPRAARDPESSEVPIGEALSKLDDETTAALELAFVPSLHHETLRGMFQLVHTGGDKRTQRDWRRSFRLWAQRTWNERRSEVQRLTSSAKSERSEADAKAAAAAAVAADSGPLLRRGRR